MIALSGPDQKYPQVSVYSPPLASTPPPKVQSAEILAPDPLIVTEAEACSTHLCVHFVSAMERLVLPECPVAPPVRAQAVVQPPVPLALELSLREKGAGLQ